MPTDLGMKNITRHVLGTCRHTRHFYLDPPKSINQIFWDIYNICSPKIFKKDYSISPLRQTVRHFFGFKSPVYIVTNPHTNSLLTPKNTFFSSTPADLLPIYPT